MREGYDGREMYSRFRLADESDKWSMVPRQQGVGLVCVVLIADQAPMLTSPTLLEGTYSDSSGGTMPVAITVPLERPASTYNAM